MKLFYGIIVCVVVVGLIRGQKEDEVESEDENQTQSPNPRPQPRCTPMYSLENTCQNLARACVNRMNDQIRAELNASYTYMAMGSYFARDDIAYRGASKFFYKASEEERQHAIKFIEYLNKRGGKLHLKQLHPPPVEFGTLLEAFQSALNLEKAVNDHLLLLHWEAQEKNDPHLQDFIEGDFLTEQVDAIKQLADFVTILGRSQTSTIGWHIFDEELYEDKR